MWLKGALAANSYTDGTKWNMVKDTDHINNLMATVRVDNTD
jgi:hypothetical protein